MISKLRIIWKQTPGREENRWVPRRLGLPDTLPEQVAVPMIAELRDHAQHRRDKRLTPLPPHLLSPRIRVNNV
eukprot:COSAG05_NODE_2890_length_2535_cov_28.331281_2_plen_73_part_00